MNLEIEIGENIRRAREARKLTQAQLGEALKNNAGEPWTRQAVSAAEKGRRGFPAAELCTLAYILRVPVRNLLEPTTVGPVEVDSTVMDWQRLFGSAYGSDANLIAARVHLTDALAAAVNANIAAEEAAATYEATARRQHDHYQTGA